MSDLLKVENLTKWYIEKKVNKKNGIKIKKQIIKAVDGISFSLNKGEILGIIGESGCGKSTLGRLLVALEKPTDGRIEINNEQIRDILKKDSLGFRKECQMIFQNPFDTFDPRDNVQKILTTALKIHRIGNSKEERINICMSALENSGIRPAKEYINRYPHELSGGQLQRISIIRSMLLNPRLIIADEPVSMLDISVRTDIINLLLKLTKEQETGMIFISHDIATTRYISHRIAVMYLGRIVEIGSTEDIIKNPKHPYTKALISNCSSIDSTKSVIPIKIYGEPSITIEETKGCYFAPRCYVAGERCKKEYPPMEKVDDNHYVSCFYLFN